MGCLLHRHGDLDGSEGAADGDVAGSPGEGVEESRGESLGGWRGHAEGAPVGEAVDVDKAGLGLVSLDLGGVFHREVVLPGLGEEGLGLGAAGDDAEALGKGVGEADPHAVAAALDESLGGGLGEVGAAAVAAKEDGDIVEVLPLPPLCGGDASAVVVDADLAGARAKVEVDPADRLVAEGGVGGVGDDFVNGLEEGGGDVGGEVDFLEGGLGRLGGGLGQDEGDAAAALHDGRPDVHVWPTEHVLLVGEPLGGGLCGVEEVELLLGTFFLVGHHGWWCVSIRGVTLSLALARGRLRLLFGGGDPPLSLECI